MILILSFVLDARALKLCFRFAVPNFWDIVCKVAFECFERGNQNIISMIIELTIVTITVAINIEYCSVITNFFLSGKLVNIQKIKHVTFYVE